MKFSRTISLVLLLTVFVSTSCSKSNVSPSSSTGALSANGALENAPTRPFDKRSLTGSGYHFMNEFIRSDVRARMDEEPVGDADSSYDPAASAPPTSDEPSQTEPESAPDPQHSEPQLVAEEPVVQSDAIKFSWASKAFGETVRSNPGTSGFIVLYADEDYYDINALMAFVEEGRNRIADAAQLGGDKIQVIYGGYRSMPQVEMWVMPGDAVPELKPGERPRTGEPEE